jgi:hypothetical protein
VFFSAWRKKKTDEKGKFGSANYVTQCSGQKTTVVMAVWAVRLPSDFFIFMKVIMVMTILV